jgi:hypothetical protein
MVLLDVLLNSVSNSFIAGFTSMFIKLDYSFLSFVLFVPSSGISILLAPQNYFGSIPFFSILWNSLRRVDVSSSLKVRQKWRSSWFESSPGKS